MAREMKDSGIEWIGKIPKNWEITKLKNVSEINSGEYISKEDYTLQGTFDIIGSNGKIGKVNKTNINKKVITTGRVGSIGTSRIVQDVWVTDNALIIETKKNILLEYLAYIIPMFPYEIISTGTAQPLITATILKNQYIPYPNLYNQQKIANFLDEGCIELDNVLEKTRTSIEEYKKLKQAVITQAVTKGIKGDREKKDSGVEWIGEIPLEWEVCKFGKCVAIKSNLVAPEKYMDYLQIAPDNIEKGSARLMDNIKTVKEVGVISGNHLFHKGQIIYSKIRPMLNKLVIAPFDGLCSADMYPIETENDTEYIVFLMLSDLFLSQVGLVTMNRVKMPKINQSELANIRVPLPKIEEQREIAKYLKYKCIQLDEIIDKKEKYLSEIENYKKSLIYEYVTGKKEVPQEY